MKQQEPSYLPAMKVTCLAALVPCPGRTQSSLQMPWALLQAACETADVAIVDRNSTIGHIWLWINTYENTIFRGMNIHKSQLFWCEQKRYYWFWHTAISTYWVDYYTIHVSCRWQWKRTKTHMKPLSRFWAGQFNNGNPAKSLRRTISATNHDWGVLSASQSRVMWLKDV